MHGQFGPLLQNRIAMLLLRHSAQWGADHMRGSGVITALAFAAFMALFSGCNLLSGGRSGGEARERPVVVVDALETIKDGGSISWKVPAGRYQLDMTSTSPGAGVEWIGASCGAAQEVKTYAGRCELESTGQLVVNNPTTLGLGDPVTVTVKLTRLLN